jgi:hypothetical protein
MPRTDAPAGLAYCAADPPASDETVTAPVRLAALPLRRDLAATIDRTVSGTRSAPDRESINSLFDKNPGHEISWNPCG